MFDFGTIDLLSLGLYCFATTASGLLIYHSVALYYHWRYYVRRADAPGGWKCQPKRALKPRLARQARLYGSLNMTLAGVITGVLVYAIADHGLWTMLYFDVSQYGWVYLAVSGPLVWLVTDLMAYYIHRMFHIKWLFRRFHRIHHRYVATTPWTATAMHPVEMLSLQLTALATIFFIPLHPAVISSVLVYNLVFNIIDHSGVKLESSLPWQGSSRYHDDHHAHFHCNFGQHMTLWDRLHGTLRRQKRVYGVDVFGGRGIVDGAEQGPPPFVDY